MAAGASGGDILTILNIDGRAELSLWFCVVVDFLGRDEQRHLPRQKEQSRQRPDSGLRRLAVNGRHCAHKRDELTRIFVCHGREIGRRHKDEGTAILPNAMPQSAREIFIAAGRANTALTGCQI
jgi:hypothetical protein